MFQFRISAILIAMLAVALASWLLFVLPLDYYIIVMLCVHAIVPAFVVAGIIHFRGYRQTFFIGAAPIMAAVFFRLAVHYTFDELDHLFRGVGPQRVMLMVPFVLSCLSGLLAVLIRRWATKAGS